MGTRRTAIVAIVAALALVEGAPASAASPKVERRCRKEIGKQAVRMAQKALARIDACHKRRDAGKFSGNCNAVPGTLFTLPVQYIARACKSADQVNANYPNGDVGAAVSAAVQRLVTASAEELQGGPSIKGNRAAVKCHGAIGKGRTQIVLSSLNRSVKCQGRRPTFGPIEASCIQDGGGSVAKATSAIGGKCSGVDGATVDSCSSLPGCVATSANDTGGKLARAIYGGPIVCGNDLVEEPQEECDDGNTDSTDACTGDCRNALCGDGFVQAGVEECDDANIDDTDACLVGCKAATCGDGKVRANVEECDDGNADPGDGCGDCRVVLECGANGAEVTVALSHQQRLKGLTLELSYPAGMSIPGTGADETVLDRVIDARPAPAEFLLPNDNPIPTPERNPCNGAQGCLRVLYVGSTNLGSEELLRIRFDCAPGTIVARSDVPCVVIDASDDFAHPLDPTEISCIPTLRAP